MSCAGVARQRWWVACILGGVHLQHSDIRLMVCRQHCHLQSSCSTPAHTRAQRATYPIKLRSQKHTHLQADPDSASALGSSWDIGAPCPGAAEASTVMARGERGLAIGASSISLTWACTQQIHVISKAFTIAWQNTGLYSGQRAWQMCLCGA